MPAGDIKKLKEGGEERCPGREAWPRAAASGGGAAPPLAAAPTRRLRLPAAAQASPPWRASCSPPPRSWAPSRASAKPKSQSSRRWVGALCCVTAWWVLGAAAWPSGVHGSSPPGACLYDVVDPACIDTGTDQPPPSALHPQPPRLCPRASPPLSRSWSSGRS